MEDNLQHEDLLIKLRAKLNEEKVKLWEPPYLQADGESQALQDLAKKYATDLSISVDTVIQALLELQVHSLDRSKANAEFKETGCATFRVKATVPGEGVKVIKVQKKLDVMGSEMIAVVAAEIGVVEERVKLIFNGKVIKPTPSLEEQGVKNGAQIMALIMAGSPEDAKKEDKMYMEMKATRDDAMLLSECIDDFADDDEYMKLEDQSGQTVELPPTERRSLLVGLALHERGRAAARQRDYPLALVLFLEADRQFNECRSSILQTVDNWALLQLDIAWCYLCLRSLAAAGDAAARLARAQRALSDTYGARPGGLDGAAANERAVMMRLHLLQGIVAYHQNRRTDAAALLDTAERELNELRVDETAVCGLVELGWSLSQARAGLRAARGDPHRAHHYLAERRQRKEQARESHRMERQKRQLGLCADGSPVRQALVAALSDMGYPRALAILALRNSNNHAAEAVRIIQEQPELLADSELSADEADTPSSEESLVVPDTKLAAELEAMGYGAEEATTALRASGNRINDAVGLLVGGQQAATAHDGGQANPSTSAAASRKLARKHSNKRKEREQALERLSSAIRGEDDDHLDSDLVQEEQFLASYKSLL